MTNPTPHGQVPEALTYERDRAIMEGERNASLDAYSRVVLLTSAESRLYEAAFTNGWNRCAAHVQNPAENEHVAGDVSKNGAEVNTKQQPAPATQQAGERVYAFRRKGLADFCTCDAARYEELSNKPHLFETRIFYTAPQPLAAPTTQQAGEVVAVKAMGYGGSTGINDYLMSDGTVKAMRPAEVKWATQPSPTAQAAECVPAVDGALEVADAMADSQYLAGVSAGWNAANADDPNAALQKLHESRAGYLKPLRAARAPADSVLEDAALLDFLVEQRAYVVSDPDTCPGYWLHFVHKETGKCWVQADEHPTPRAAIDAAMNKGGAA